MIRNQTTFTSILQPKSKAPGANPMKSDLLCRLQADTSGRSVATELLPGDASAVLQTPA